MIFRSIALLESRHLRNRTVILIFLVVLLVSTRAVLIGIDEYRYMEAEKEQFLHYEKTLFATHESYRQYGEKGIGIFFAPPPLSILFSSPLERNDLVGRVTAEGKLSIHNDLISRTLFAGTFVKHLKFSDLNLILGTLISLLCGFSFYRSRDYLRFLSSSAGYRPVLYSMLTIRFIMLVISFIVICILMLLLVYIYGISISFLFFTGVWRFILATIICMGIFYLTGVVLGMASNRRFGYTAAFLVWVFGVFFLPYFINSITWSSARQMESVFSSRNKQLVTIVEFTQQIKKSDWKKIAALYREVDGMEHNPDIIAIEYYKKYVIPRIAQIEHDKKFQLKERVEINETAAMFSPVTYYLSTSSGMSGKGFGDFLAFYTRMIRMQRKFSTFILEQNYFFPGRSPESFVQGEENVFYSSAGVHHISWLGAALNLLYIVILMHILSQSLYNRIFSVNNRSLPELATLGPDFKLRTPNLVLTESDTLKNQLFYYFSGSAFHFPGQITVNRQPVPVGPGHFLYICPPRHIPPELRGIDLFTIFCRIFNCHANLKSRVEETYELHKFRKKSIRQLSEGDKINLLLAIAKIYDGDVFLFDDTARGMRQNDVVHFKQQLAKLNKKIVIYLTGDYWHAPFIDSNPLRLLKEPEDALSFSGPNII